MIIPKDLVETLIEYFMDMNELTMLHDSTLLCDNREVEMERIFRKHKNSSAEFYFRFKEMSCAKTSSKIL